jgi:hypothetical protein
VRTRLVLIPVVALGAGDRPDLVGQRVIQEFGYALAPTSMTEAT